MTSRCDLGAISARSPVYLGDDLGDDRRCARWHAARRITGACCARAGAGSVPPHRPDEARARVPPRHVRHVRVVTRTARQPEARPRAGDHRRRRLLGEGQRGGHQAEGARGVCASFARDLRGIRDLGRSPCRRARSRSCSSTARRSCSPTSTTLRSRRSRSRVSSRSSSGARRARAARRLMSRVRGVAAPHAAAAAAAAAIPHGRARAHGLKRAAGECRQVDVLDGFVRGARRRDDARHARRGLLDQGTQPEQLPPRQPPHHHQPPRRRQGRRRPRGRCSARRR